MLISRFLKVAILVLGILFIALQVLEYEAEATGVGALTLILLVVLYLKSASDIRKYFLAFLIIFTVAHILNFVSWYFPSELNELTVDYSYYITNILYISAYIFLIYQIIYQMSFREMFSRFSVSIFILLVLNIFCVTLVTETTQNVLSLYEYILEFLYNGVIMLLISAALINYMYRDDSKAMLLLVGTVFIFFSEIIQLAYYYISPTNALSVIYSTFLVLAFLFLYFQSLLEHTGPIEEYSDEEVKA